MKFSFQKLISLILCLVILVGLLPTNVRADDIFSTEIWTAEDFYAIADQPNGRYRLMADLDLGIHTPLPTFSGSLDGNGHSISYKLNILEGVYHYALFYTLDSGAQVTNLVLRPDIDVQISEPVDCRVECRVAAMAVYCFGSVTATTVSGSIRVNALVSESSLCFVGGLSTYTGSQSGFHSCVIDTQVDISMPNGQLYYYGIAPDHVYYSDLMGSARLECDYVNVRLLSYATDSTCTQDVTAGANSGHICGDSSGQSNALACDFELYNIGNTGNYTGTSFCCISQSTSSTYTGQISSTTAGELSVLSGTTNCTAICDLNRSGENTSHGMVTYGIKYGQYNTLRGDITVSNPDGATLKVISGQYNLYEGDALVTSDFGNIETYGIAQGNNNIFYGNLSAVSNSGRIIGYGISCNDSMFTGDIYGYSKKSVSLYGAGGNRNILYSNIYALGAPLPEITPLGDNSYFEGSATGGFIFGIGSNSSAFADLTAFCGYSQIFLRAVNSYFKGNVTVYYDEDYLTYKNPHISLDVFNGATRQCVADLNIVMRAPTDESSIWFSMSGNNYCEGSAKIYPGNATVGIPDSIPSTIYHNKVGTWTSSQIRSGIWIHDEKNCTYGCPRIINAEENEQFRNKDHYDCAIGKDNTELNSSKENTSAGWDGTINPDTGDYTPERDPASYTIKLLDAVDEPVANARLVIGGKNYTTDKNGCVSVKNGPGVISNLEVQMKNDSGKYETICIQKAFYPIPDRENIFRMTFDMDISLTFLGAEDAENATGTANGFSAQIGAQTVPLFKFPINISLDQTLFKVLPISTSYDPKTRSVKSVIGLKTNKFSKLRTLDGKYNNVAMYQVISDMVESGTLGNQDQKVLTKFLKDAEKNVNANIFTRGWTVQGLGYAESDVSDLMNPVIKNGGLILAANYEYRTLYHLVPYAPAAYVTLAFKGGIQSLLDFATPKDSNGNSLIVTGKVTPKISAEGALGVGARVARLYMEAGIRGTLSGEISAPFQGIYDSLSVIYTGKVFGEVRLLGFSYPVEQVIQENVLWPQASTFAARSLAAAVSEPGEYTISPRDYADKASVTWSRAAERYLGLDEENSYPYAEVSIYPLANGNYLLLYTDDDLNRGDADRSTLRACIGKEVDGELVWGEAITVEQDGTGDYGFEAAVSGNQVAVVWQDAQQTFGNGKNLQLSTMASSIGLSQTILDCSGAIPIPSEVAEIEATSGYPYSVSVNYDGNALRTAWVTTNNPNPGFYTANEKETIWLSESFGAEGTAIAQNQTTVSGIALLKNNLLWCTGTEDACTLWNRTNNGTITEADSGSISNLQSNSGQFCYISNGTLYQGKNDWGKRGPVSTGETMTGIVRISSNGEIYAGQLNTNSSRICILEGEELLPIGQFDGYLSTWDVANNHIAAVQRTGFTASDSASFISKTTEEIVDTKVGTVSFDNSAVYPGRQLEMTVPVSNDGYNTLEQLHVTVTAADSSILMDENVSCYIPSGDDQDVSFELSIPENYKPQKVTISVEGATQTTTLGGTNLMIEASWKSYDAKGVCVTVTNTAFGTGRGTLTLKDSNGEVLGSQKVTVEQGAHAAYWFAFDEYYTKDATLTVTLTSSGEDLISWDNTDTVHIKPIHAAKLRLPGTIELDTGTTTTIEVRAIPEGSLIPKLTYKSEDPSVVTVTSKGKLSGISEGNANVIVTDEDGNTYTVIVTVSGKTSSAPDAPVIKVSGVSSSGKNKVSWESVDGAAKYTVYCADSKNGTYTRVITTSKTYTTHTAGTAGNRYYYYVVSVAADGTRSEKSNIVNRTCDLARPVVSLSNISSSGKIKIFWTAVEGAKEFEVWRATSKEGTFKCISTTSKTSITNTSTEAGKTYYYKIKAIAENSAANSAYSEVTYRTCDLAQPTITLSNVASSGKIKVSWETIDGVKEYKVYRSTSKDGTHTLMKTTTDTSYINTSAETGKTYYYKVIAVHEKSVANSAYSEIKSRTCDLPQPKVTLSNVASSGKIKISWEAIDGAKEYKVYRATSRDGEYNLIKTTTNTSLTNTSTTAGTTYYYKVKAVAEKSAADSAYSAIKSRTCDLPRPDATISLNSSGKPKVSWEAVDGAVSYEVYRATSKSGDYKLMKTTANLSYANTSAEAGKTYYYKVAAVCSNTNGNSANSSIVSITSK